MVGHHLLQRYFEKLLCSEFGKFSRKMLLVASDFSKCISCKDVLKPYQTCMMQLCCKNNLNGFSLYLEKAPYMFDWVYITSL